MDIKDFYKELLGFPPYEYQIKVAELLLAGKNVILSVPTGAGKTWASIIPFLVARQNNISSFPQKMIYSLPLRTLANSIHKDVNDNLTKSKTNNALTSIQTGEYNYDKYFEKDIVFSTIDQTLSNFLSFPLSLSKRQANINAGAIIGSYLVFDEFHLLDANLSMATTMGMLRMLSNMTRFCIMTATMSDGFIKFITENSELKNVEVVTLKEFPNDIPNINSLIVAENMTKKEIIISEKTINANDIVSNHKNRTIVICNRVETAQNLFIEIEKIKNPETKIFCIHGRFFNKDRKKKEHLVKEYFNEVSDKNAILISTQVIEAGMDISCEILHTEISPVNSFLQRAGRCARYANETGKIFVYDILTVNEKLQINEQLTNKNDEKKEIRKLNNKYLPYDSDLCQKTFETLKKTKYIDEKISKELVNKIMTGKELNDIEKIKSNLFNQENIKESWVDCNKNNYRTTIRDIQSVELIIIDDEIKNDVVLQPYAFESIGLYKWTFISKWKKIIDNNDNNYPVLKLEESSFLDFGDENYELKPANYDKITDNRFYVHSDFFNYDDDIGLNFLNIGKETSDRLIKENKKGLFKPLKSDTFIEHNKALLKYYKEYFKPKMSFIFKELPEFMQTKNIDFDKLIEIMIVMHDYGKLNKNWQVPIKKYQSKKSGKEISEALAHSDFDRTNQDDKKLSEKYGMNKRPEHSVIGAFALKSVLSNGLPEVLTDPICAAISKHHNADTIVKKVKRFSVEEKDYCSIKKLLKIIQYSNLPIQVLYEREISFALYNDGGKIKQKIFEFLLSRILRICDQKATENI